MFLDLFMASVPASVTTPFMYSYLHVFIFTERGGREKLRERNTDVKEKH